jgi:hypothetical protein
MQPKNIDRQKASCMTPLFSRKLSRLGIGVVILAAAIVPTSTASAVGTRTFQLEKLDDLKGGDLTGVSVDSSGTVRAGFTLGTVPITDVTSVWSSVVLADGSVLLGTGSDGKIYKVSTTGQTSLVATTGQMAVSSLAVAWNGDVIAGTFPEGKLYKLPGGGGTGGQAAQFGEIAGTEDIWALAFDAKSGSLYAGTGPEGKVFKIDQQGKSQVFFDSDEAHITALAVAEDGSVYAGSNGKALLYKIAAPGRATVAYDFDGDEVKAIAFGKNGSMFVIANKMGEQLAPPKRNKGAAAPTPTKPSKPGKGSLFRFGKDGIAEELLSDNETHFVSLSVDEAGAPYVGTGAEGRVYTVDDAHTTSLVADTDERQIGALVVAGKRRFVATTDPVVFHEIKGTGGGDAVWTSKVLDAGLRASFGRLNWRGDGQLELSTRSGNTATPDTSWSAWSAGLGAPGDVTSPPGRYVQVRARWSRDPKATLRELTMYFVTDNARPVVTSIEAVAKSSKLSLKSGIPSSGGEAPKPSPGIKLSWKVDNPDQDDLRYRVMYRIDGQATWRFAHKPTDKITRPELDWDTTGLPEGTYRIRVEASDEAANPPDRVQRHVLESGAVLVDNTPPVYKSLSIQGRKLKGEVADGLGPISRIEVAVAGTDEWRPLFPSDGIFDEATETFDADISTVVPAGTQLVVVRTYDTAGNVVTRDVDAR